MYKTICWLYHKVINCNWNKHYIVRLFGKIIYYILICYLKATQWLPQNNINKTGIHNNEKYIVSLTTFPKRIDKVWISIETILRQKIKPDAIILWLYDGEFSGLSSLPNSILRLKKRGLQIRFCSENIMSHKKYYYALQTFHNYNIILIDDDFIYPLDLIGNLINTHIKYPKCICCSMAREIKIIDNKILPYLQWSQIHNNSGPSNILLALSGGGTLIPPKSLHNDVFDIKNIIEKSLTSDDIWLKIMSLKNNTKIVCFAGHYTQNFIQVIIKNDVRLMDTNIYGGRNDEIFKLLIENYHISLSKFKNKLHP